MVRSTKLVAPMALAAAAALSLAAPLSAQAASGDMYRATLNQVNHSGGSGSLSITLNGDQATIDEHWSGLASTFKGGPFPHVQHIHFINGKGVCPPPSADKNGDNVVNTEEGQVFYGELGTTLSVKGDTSPKAATDIKIAPSGSSTNYHRTITLDSKTLTAIKNDTAVIVVHGLDPSTLSKRAQKEKSPLVPSLPLAATAPALCGPLHAAAGGPNTGAGSTAGTENPGLFALGGALIAAAAGAFALRRRRITKTDAR